MNIKQKLTTAAVLGTMMAALVAQSSFAATTVKIKKNGAGSHNTVKSYTWNVNTVSQGTATDAHTGVGSKSSTGDNKSSFNVGGDSTVTTGDATNTVKVTVNGGSNTNTGSECGCQPEGSTDVTVSGNGAFSSNYVKIVSGSYNSVTQENVTDAHTMVMTGASTGGNSSSFNTGSGSSVESGDASNTVSVTVSGGSNTN